MKVSQAIDGARARLGAMLRREPKPRKPPPPHGAAPLVWVWFLAFIAVATLIGSTWMLMVFIAGSVGSVDWGFDWRAGNDGEAARFTWFAQAQIHLLVGIGLLCFCLGIAAFNAVWLHVRTHLYGIFRAVVTALGALVALFMVSGAIVVQQWGTVERERDEIADVRSTGVAAATARERLETARRQLADLRNHDNQYMAVAASVGAAEFERSYLSAEALDGSDAARRDLLRRSLGAARRADALEAEIAGLEAHAAEAQVTAATAEVERVELTGWMPWFSRLLEDIRKPFIAVLGELLAMTMFGVALAAALSRRQTVEKSGWAPEDRRLEDHTDEAPIATNPAQMQTVLREENPETGEKRILITPKPHWRTLKKGKKETVEVAPEMLPDEEGVYHDGGGRAASAGPAEEQRSDEHSASNEQIGPAEGQVPFEAPEPTGDEPPAVAVHEDVAHLVSHPELSEQPDYSDYEAAGLLEPAPEPAIDEPHAEEQQGDEREPDEQGEHLAPPETADEAIEPAAVIDAEPERVGNEAVTEHDEQPVDHIDLPEQDEPERAPETDPRRLIASVAAE